MPAMAESTGMGAAASMSSDKGDMGSNVKVVGLFGMGLTLMLIGLSFLPSPYGNGFGGWGSFWAALPVAATFGGVVLLIVGLIALYKGHVYWGSAFASYGAFFIIWTNTINSPSGVAYYGLAGITFVFLLMTLTFLISSMKHGWVTFFLFLFFFISAILWLVVEWMTAAGNSVSSGQWWATAAITFIAGLIAWYAATAHLTNWTYGKKVLPG